MKPSQKKPKVASGRLTPKTRVQKSEDLMHEAMALRIEFLEADLQIAATFVSLARFDLENGEIPHASRLLSLAQKASEVISDMLHQVATADAKPLRVQLRALEDSIRKAQAHPKAPAA